MIRLLATSLLVFSFFGTGCCHCYQRTYYPGRGPIAAAVAKPIRAVVGCNKGCGDVYWGEWVSDPPDDCDPCCNGEFVGPRDCCGGRPHTRLCIWQILESFRGVRGSCGGGCVVSCSEGGCGGSCGSGGCDGGCGGSCGSGGDWDYGGEYAGEIHSEYQPSPGPYSGPPSGSMHSVPGNFNSPAWNRTVPQAAPGVPTSTGRLPTRHRSVNDRRYGPPLRSVNYEEEAVEKIVPERTAATVSEKAQPPALMADVLPDPRSSMRR